MHRLRFITEGICELELQMISPVALRAIAFCFIVYLDFMSIWKFQWVQFKAD